jgi:hypothetical protein
VFGDGSHTSASTIDKVRGSATQRDRSRQTTAGLKFDGPLFALPGGALRLAVGSEYRAEAFGSAYVYDDFSLSPISGGDTGYLLATCRCGLCRTHGAAGRTGAGHFQDPPARALGGGPH